MAVKHPAKYSDEFLPYFLKVLKEHSCVKVLDPFAGVGKLGELKTLGFKGKIFANEIEPDWITPNMFKCDVISCMDAECLADIYTDGFFDAICTSPTYGNRMADHHNAKDGSKRTTYTHCIGHDLQDGNTGKMQWGSEYREKHKKIYQTVCRLIKPDGIFILNISNHIRGGKEVDVCGWHKQEIITNGFVVGEDFKIPTRRNRFGANAAARVEYEHILVFERFYGQSGALT